MMTKIENTVEVRNNADTALRSDIIYRATACVAVSAYRNPVYPFTSTERRTYLKGYTTKLRTS